MIYKSLNELLKNRIFYHFSQICKIPHGSYFEKDLSNYIKYWAKDLNFEVHQDDHCNLLIRKKASTGYEEKEPIILQAHLDMVCEKRNGIEHDFKKDSIKIQLDGDTLSTGNKTTLGADDGIGVALAMAILENKNLNHPPIDVIFTTAEEEDMSGALNIDTSWFHTNRIINIDNSNDIEIIAGSSGGKGVELKIPLTYTEISKDYISYEIKIAGLTGGHSGEDINKGLANANVILARALNFLRKEFNFLISDIKGGNFRLAIPREAYVIITFNSEDINIFKNLIRKFEDEIKKVYSNSEKKLFVEIKKIDLKDKVFSQATTEKIIDTILLSPNAISEMMYNLNVVESSCNLGEIYIKNDYIYFITEIRATFEFNREYIYNKILLIAKHFGGEVKEFAIYPSWIYKEDSRLRNLANTIHKKMFGEEMRVLVLHAGLECGCFTDKIKNMDAISIGPNNVNLHSPYEALSVSSTDKIYNFLVKILENLD